MTHLPCHLSPRSLLFSMFLLYYCTILTNHSCFVVRVAHSLLALMFMTNCDMWDDKNFTKLFTKLVYVVRYPRNLYLVSTSVSLMFTGLGNAWWKQNWFSSWCPMMHDVNDWSNSGVYWETTQIWIYNQDTSWQLFNKSMIDNIQRILAWVMTCWLWQISDSM